MIHTTQGYVLIYNKDLDKLKFLQKVLSDRHIKIFGSDNIFRLLKYMNELKTDAFLLSISQDDQPAKTLLAELDKQNSHIPLIILKPQRLTLPSTINAAHYLTEDDSTQNLLEILESYHIGNKRHKIMFVRQYTPNFKSYCPLLSEISDNNCFEVYNQNAAQQYLAKNIPSFIFFEKKSSFNKLIPSLPKQHIFYVDRPQDIAEIKKILH